MQEIFFTILAIWVLYKIFGGNDSSKSETPMGKPFVKVFVSKKDKVSNSKKSDKDIGDYVDYEEVK